MYVCMYVCACVRACVRVHTDVVMTAMGKSGGCVKFIEVK